jgi:predicted nucleic acid-binding protein
MPGANGPARPAVVDASVAVRWVVPEQGSEHAVALLRESFRWLAPRLMLTEVASALRRKVVERELSTEVALEALDVLMTELGGAIELAADETIMPLALTLALSLEHKLPDCVYLALAERTGADLVTADRQLDRIARARGIPTTLVATTKPG